MGKNIFTLLRSKFVYLKRCNHTFIKKISKGAKIRNRYNKVPHLTKDTNTYN